ncbi:2-C-methyl-D-erythritol 4-phosphate cytidylyltransferase [Mannheimia haemolytica]
MQAEKPKQYLQLKGKTILEHTVSIFLEHPHVEKVIVAVARKDSFYSTLELLKSPKIQLVFGGETRADSVLNALQEINTENAWALVHDAARPCLKRSDLDKLLQINDPQGGILAIPAVDTMKRTNGTKIAHTEDRSTLWHALTPQFFPAQALKQALSSAFANKLQVTDEASAMELAGYQPQLVSGRSDNIKITRPEDLALAEFYLTHNLEN